MESVSRMMRVIVNQQVRELAPASKVSDLLTVIDAKPPYAVAVNLDRKSVV